MIIDKDLVRKMAELSRVKLSEAEVSRLETEFAEIFDYFSSISELGSEGEPLYYPAGGSGNRREDRPAKGKDADGIVAQFAHKEGRLLVAPKALD
jgi:aspartyl/glutamyl-tRNA(Asn/Gln) amidotransferase C subunit